jgi:hypothetical protein
MTDRERSAARRRPQLFNDPPPIDPAAADSAEVNTRNDIWVANFMSRLTRALRNMASRKPK